METELRITTLISVLLISISAALGQEQLLIWAGHEAHVYELPAPLPANKVDAGPFEGLKVTQKMAVSAQLKKPIKSLGSSRTFNLREQAVSAGIPLKKEDLILYSPDSGWIYTSASRENAELIRTFFKMRRPFPLNMAYHVLLEITTTDPRAPAIVKTLSKFKFAAFSGQRAEFEIEGRRLVFDLVVGPDGILDCGVSGALPIAKKKIAFDLRVTGGLGENIVILEQENREEKLLITTVVKRHPKFPSKEEQEAKIADIKRELKAQGVEQDAEPDL